MRTFVLGAVAAVGLALGATPDKASAYWATRTAYRFDPVVGTTVAFQEQYWVPDVVAVPAVTPVPAVTTVPVYPSSVYYPAPVYPVYPRGYYSRAYYYGPGAVIATPGVSFSFRFRR